MMRRRRPFRPVGRPILRAGHIPGHPLLPPKLQKANQLYQNEKYEEAAFLYEELFDEVIQRKFPRSPRLLIQAGFAWFKTENSERGLAAFKKGFSVWIEQKQWQLLHKAFLATDSRLKNEGFNNESAVLQAWLAIQVPEDVKMSQIWQTASQNIEQTTSKTNLPSVCPQCGAPVDPKDVNWFSDEIGQCPFCNIILTGA